MYVSAMKHESVGFKAFPSCPLLKFFDGAISFGSMAVSKVSLPCQDFHRRGRLNRVACLCPCFWTFFLHIAMYM